MTSRPQIDDFLAQKRFAFVGVSRQAKDFSRALFREFRAQGYDPVPVHPEADEIEGERCYASISEIQPPVDNALLMTSPAVTRTVADQCAAAGIKRIWIYHDAACTQSGISVIAGECPMMYLPNPGWIHRFHGWVKKISGTYPK